MARILVCEICGSEKLERRTCEGCHGLNDEEWAIKDAKDAYLAGHITIIELEKRIAQAFIDPPRPDYHHIIYG